MFKIGDMVVRTEGNYQAVQEGGRYEVTKVSEGGMLQLRNQGGVWYEPGCFIKLSLGTPSVSLNKYTFQTGSVKAIRWGDIGLSMDNPMVSVWVDGSMYVGIHDSIGIKLDNCKGSKRLREGFHNATEGSVYYDSYDSGTISLLAVPSDISKLIAVVRAIRNAKWKGQPVQVSVTSIKL